MFTACEVSTVDVNQDGRQMDVSASPLGLMLSIFIHTFNAQNVKTDSPVCGVYLLVHLDLRYGNI